MNKHQNIMAAAGGFDEKKYFINNVSRNYLFVKRLFDIAFSLLAILLCAPVFLAVFLWSKFKSRGAVFVSGELIGFRGIGFRAYLFSAHMPFACIRKLPLLINVLKGDMSFVGPRAVSAGKEFDAEWHYLRNSVKPGLTGLWQISGSTGAFDEMVRADMKYIRERSLRNDFKILIKALSLAFRRCRALSKGIGRNERNR
ncbi:MAG: UDP-glucose:undecaprenyl-phosphate glucose-1-phosphate transferase [Firmicutes bacterium ADurb.Bin182]|nr:MAG: UDP-glucose:undecaprenyl-phosphate glucose-1-phosphate transferase [Firmicutes bacterium ADurb.Bin182]